MNDRSSLVLEAVLRVIRPAVRLLLQNGVSYGAFASALKRVFLAAAQDELKQSGSAWRGPGATGRAARTPGGLACSAQYSSDADGGQRLRLRLADNCAARPGP